MEIGQIRNSANLCEFLGIELAVFEHIRANRDSLMRIIPVPKRGGEYRTVYSVTDGALRDLLRKVRRTIDAHYTFRDCVQGFVRRTSIVTNARHHLGKRIVVNVDIRNFFETITIDRVRAVFSNMGFLAEHADMLAELTTVEGFLATGFSPSPVISNVVCERLDTDFLALAARYGATYTRYGDDITISGDQGVPTRDEIEAVIAQHRFLMNDRKYRVQRKGGSQYVTGLTVCDPKGPHIPRRLKRRLRLETYFLRKDGAGHEHLKYHTARGTRHVGILPLKVTRYTVAGWIYFISAIDGVFANWLLEQWGAGDLDSPPGEAEASNAPSQF